jgi:hypothetical protein
MADEQTIYLSPEEELTSVRERLEKTQARRIILVIPQQTQLRSHVGWRLIHARMREMGKELLVISPDRQIRAVARAAGFRVAESKESTSNRPRTAGGTRPGAINTRGTAHSRLEGGRGRGPESRTSQRPGGGRGRSVPNSGSRSLLRPPTPEKPDYEDELVQEGSNMGEIEVEGIHEIAPPAALFEAPEERFGPSYNYHISTTPSVRPSVPYVEEEEEEENLTYDNDDYNTAQSIMRAFHESQGGSVKDEPLSSQPEKESQAPQTQSWRSDPYAFLEDDQQLAPLPEQKGAAPLPIEDIAANKPEISDRPTDIMESEVEYLGDMDDMELPDIGARKRPDMPPPVPIPEEEIRPRRRTGQMQQPIRHSPRAPRPDTQDISQDDDLLSLPDRPTRVPSRSLRPSRALAGQREPQPIITTANPQTNARAYAGPSSRKPTGRQARPSGAPARPPITTQRKTQRSNHSLTIVLTILLLVVVVAGLLFYLVPTATVTISLPAKAYTQTVQFNATADPHATVTNKVVAQTLAQTFSVSGQGKATGTTTIGNAQAQGFVAFTNNGNTDITVPNNTIVSTVSGIQFITGSEVLVAANSTFLPIPVPVSAQQSGDSGNVSAGSITNIPQSSLVSIAQFNKTTVSAVKLAVSNSNTTSGGGASTVPAVTTQNRNTLTQTLHQKLQQEVKTWLAQQTHSGDVTGNPQPNILGSNSPLSQEQLTGAPGNGQAAPQGSFTGNLSLTVSVLIARAKDLQAAAGIQINGAAQKLLPASTWAAQLPVTLSHIQQKLAKDGSTLVITAKANGEIIPQISAQAISNQLAGKSLSQAESTVKNVAAVLNGGQIPTVKINIFPGFLSIMPLRAGRIRIIPQAIQPPPATPVPPRKVPNG